MCERLGCPNCQKAVSFNLDVVGQQEKAVFALVEGQPTVMSAGSVHVQTHDADALTCESCGITVSEDDLVSVESG